LPAFALGTHDLTDQPKTQAFVVVNVIELYVRHIGRALGPPGVRGASTAQPGELSRYSEEIMISRGNFACGREHGISDGGADRTGTMPGVVQERQAKLLCITARLRANLMAAQEG
jgi:hypothetical protein